MSIVILLLLEIGSQVAVKTSSADYSMLKLKPMPVAQRQRQGLLTQHHQVVLKIPLK